MLREVKVDGICHFVIHFAFKGAIGDTDDVPWLSLRVEHYACDWVVFGFDSHDELFVTLAIRRQNVEEVTQRLSLFVGVRLDHPVVSMVQKLLSLHLLE